MNIITVTNLKKTYGNFQAVKGISFSVQPGEIFGFLGPNGAGKTSTINMMIGLSRPTSGNISINGIDAVKYTKKVQSIIGIVPDESNLYDEMNGFDNLCFCASLYGMRKEEREKRAKSLLEQFHLIEAGQKPFKAYSKGMRRKLTIAAGIIHSPKILFLDEPTTGIDVESAHQIRELLLELKKNGTTVFMTTHYIEEAERICDHIAFIADGKLVASGTVTDLMSSITHGHTIQMTADSNVGNYLTELQAQFPQYSIGITGKKSIIIKSVRQIPLYPVLQFLNDKGIAIYEARELRPSLEDVFIKITGIKASNLNKKEGKGGTHK